MFRLAWASDTHLNFLRVAGALECFVQSLKDDVLEVTGWDLDALIITGDVAEGHDFGDQIEDVKKYLGKPVYFVLGNHDFYGSSFESVRSWAARLGGWLTSEGVVKLTDEVGLTGHDGWYDARIGNPYGLKMSDFRAIQDFNRKTVEDIIQLSRHEADKAASEAEVHLNKALDLFPKAIFATHYPPFEGACWHEGKMSGNEWLPWFTSKAMGDMLLKVAQARPEKQIMVLCGHTHSSGVYVAAPNLKVLTGQAVYGQPSLAGTIEIGDTTEVYLRNRAIFQGIRGLLA